MSDGGGGCVSATVLLAGVCSVAGVGLTFFAVVEVVGVIAVGVASAHDDNVMLVVVVWPLFALAVAVSGMCTILQVMFCW